MREALTEKILEGCQLLELGRLRRIAKAVHEQQILQAHATALQMTYVGDWTADSKAPTTIETGAEPETTIIPPGPGWSGDNDPFLPADYSA
ncbi:hypothetical protein IQ273_30785 [Nodosilinea sp. LEGE 07298]|uniref:hypothetical protein n=1 Tax=Nodosilinea sp. LEGE 07298 TaxID=2777970 RepID=UPI00187FFDF5|nr:hypothetical protein [Nodosilinea sp. LEGE 07298]MBE9113760.1 hypothetical protein [Nodosilinea sp. LEGE 07298]